MEDSKHPFESNGMTFILLSRPIEFLRERVHTCVCPITWLKAQGSSGSGAVELRPCVVIAPLCRSARDIKHCTL